MLPRNYIFNHIPKTGGNSLLAVCRDNLDPAEISPHLDYTGMHVMPTAQLERYRLVTGHFTLLAQSGFCRNRYSMTLVRDPIRRILSAYTYWRNQRYDVMTTKAKELEFADFVRYFTDSPLIVHNPFTHHLAGLGRDCVAYPPDECALLATAKRNLDAFNFVGICEQFGRSLHLLCAELGWRPPVTIPHENRTSSADRFGGIDPQTMSILRARNRLDLELYEYALQLFNGREARAASGSEFPGGVEPNYFVPFSVPYNESRQAAVQFLSAEWVGDESSRLLEVAVAFRAHVPIAELSLGIQFTSATGEVVWGTNTSIAYLELHYEHGRDCRAVFIVECFLPQGMYFVTVALSEPRRFGFHYHWIDNAASFTVARQRRAQSRYMRGVRLWEFSSVFA